MKLLLVLAAMSLAGCSSAPRAPETYLSGTLANWSYKIPSGETLQSAVLELDRPVVVAGLAEPASRVELVLSDRYFARWGQMVGRQTSTSCSLSVATLWGYPHASCAPGNLQLAP